MYGKTKKNKMDILNAKVIGLKRMVNPEIPPNFTLMDKDDIMQYKIRSLEITLIHAVDLIEELYKKLP